MTEDQAERLIAVLNDIYREIHLGNLIAYLPEAGLRKRSPVHAYVADLLNMKLIATTKPIGHQ